MPGWAIAAGVAPALVALIMTGTRGGLPLWMRLWLNLRGAILLAAAQSALQPGGAGC